MPALTTQQRAERVATRLRFAFSALGASNYQQAADIVGAPLKTVSNWMIGHALIPLPYALELQARGISLDWLYCGPPAPQVEAFHAGRPVGWRKHREEEV